MSKPRRPKRKVNGILLFDKPVGYSSNQALQFARFRYQAEKAGHTGSLAPLASGLLPLCFGQATKVSGILLDSDIRYIATARIGEKTNTGDGEGQVIAHSDASQLTREAVLAALPAFTGPIQQVPPMYSAIRLDGQRLYELARQGVEIEREAREVTIHSLKLLEFGEGKVVLDVRCSKGTYIRTLLEDIAAAVGQVSYLTGLHRYEVAPFLSPKMVTVAEVEEAAKDGYPGLDALLTPLAQAFSHWPSVRVDSARALHLRGGQPLRVAGSPDQGPLAVLDEAGNMLWIAEMDPNGLVAPKRWVSDLGDVA